ncbi:amidohydrolase [Motilibacter deserti]|uniref:Amidohydrolase family protein n=1 Tax=Motilibacter deserti TaxID=2714956 RepID=A0ABX0GV23_9ACTN|nr:amidohydrolase family protein [Motilibacter deserti]NHC13143.1 amidohydrolase family protein [Motilibacter deserti]
MEADLVVLGARVHTLVPGAAPATALAVSAGRIVAVGDERDVKTTIGSRTRVLETPGQVVVPGLVDAHVHLGIGLEQERGLDLSAVSGQEGLASALAAGAAASGPDEWVLAYGLDYGAVDDLAAAARAVDTAVAGRPAWVWLADLHTVLLSSAAVRLAGLTGAERFADRSTVAVDGAGVVREMSAVALASRALPAVAVPELARRLEALLRAKAATGLTGVHVLDSWGATHEALALLDAEDKLPLRVVTAPWCTAGTAGETVALAAARAAVPGRRYRVAAVKAFLDGVVDAGTAWLDEPDACGECREPQWLDPRDYREAVVAAARAGLPTWTHAIGDAAVTYALDTYALAPRPRAARHRVEHLEVLADADVERFRALDVVGSVQPAHMDWSDPGLSDTWSVRVGPARVRRAWRLGDLLAAGAPLALGSDWPISSSDPRRTLASAALRAPIGSGRGTYGDAAQALTPAQALAAMTRAPAYALREEAVSGRVAVGMRADLTVLGADPLACAPDELPDVPVLATVVAGQVVHAA